MGIRWNEGACAPHFNPFSGYMFSCFIRETFLGGLVKILAFSSKMTLDFLFWTIGQSFVTFFSPWKPPKKISVANTPFFREALEVPLGRANDPPRHALEEMSAWYPNWLMSVGFGKNTSKWQTPVWCLPCLLLSFFPKKEKKRSPGIDSNYLQPFETTFLGVQHLMGC